MIEQLTIDLEKNTLKTVDTKAAVIRIREIRSRSKVGEGGPPKKGNLDLGFYRGGGNDVS